MPYATLPPFSNAVTMLSVPSTRPILQSPRHTAALRSSSPSCARFRSLSAPRVTAAYASAEVLPPKLATAQCASLYEVLGISVGATSHEIKAAYRKLARTCHPDVAEIGRKESSADEFMKIRAAYSTLADPERRADYDHRLFQRTRLYRSPSSISASSSPVMSTFSGYTCRNWETDQCW